mgnify:FL=1
MSSPDKSKKIKIIKKRLLKVLFNASKILENNFKYAQEDFRRLKAIRPYFKTLEDFKESHDFKIKNLAILFLQESQHNAQIVIDFLIQRKFHFAEEDRILIDIIINRKQESFIVNKIVIFMITKFLEQALFFNITFTGELTHPSQES